ncbi:uncharacterized protein LOC129619127 [Condylostylus longicornis]|uniref:uncharacterized protein LOC129619127 n=1 Tax=Condylostylus longicornis TaxID=2530218 RepID=UPI00244E41E6|nr:uncharacterized protein LOC129619127 [Condylostylus longicornis]
MLLQIVPLTKMVAAAPVPEPVPEPHQKHNTFISKISPHKSSSSLLSSSSAEMNPLIMNNNLENLSNSLGNNFKTYDSKISTTNRKKKHRIRSLDTSDMPWENPCGGRFKGNIVVNQKTVTIQKRRKVYKQLRDAISLANMHEFIPGSIPINDFSEWIKHAETYNFLPVIQPKSNITLVRWHQQMQRYVGIISHLRKRTEKNSRNYRNGDFRTELYELLQASKKVLCAIETAINTTLSRPSAAQSRIRRYTKQEMNRYIEKLQTTNNRVSEIDLKYVKVNYINTTNGMMRALKRKIREMSCVIQERKHNASLETDNNASISTSSGSYMNQQDNSSSNNSKQQINFNSYFDLFDSNTSNNSNYNSKSMNSNSVEGGFKRSKFCQRILEEKHKKKSNRHRNPGAVFG